MGPVYNDLMHTVDERDLISSVDLDLGSAYFVYNDDLNSLREAMAKNEVYDDQVKLRRLSISSLVIDLALALRRKCQQIRVKKNEAGVGVKGLA